MFNVRDLLEPITLWLPFGAAIVSMCSIYRMSMNLLKLMAQSDEDRQRLLHEIDEHKQYMTEMMLTQGKMAGKDVKQIDAMQGEMDRCTSLTVDLSAKVADMTGRVDKVFASEIDVQAWIAKAQQRLNARDHYALKIHVDEELRRINADLRTMDAELLHARDTYNVVVEKIEDLEDQQEKAKPARKTIGRPRGSKNKDKL